MKAMFAFNKIHAAAQSVGGLPKLSLEP